jgi:putative endonuclease
MKDQSYIYMITNQHNKILYIGVTSHLVKRIYQHKNKLVEGFSKKYSLYKLVYYEVIDSIISAIEREKFLKKKNRDYKINLIENFNPEWSDLYSSII